MAEAPSSAPPNIKTNVNPFAETGTSTHNMRPIITSSDSLGARPLVCFSHLRWNSVFQRPQQLTSRFAKERPVLFIEEPTEDQQGPARLVKSEVSAKLIVYTPIIPKIDDPSSAMEVENLLQSELSELEREGAIFWYYTPIALEFSYRWHAAFTV